jgi:hypothetical protein
MAEDEQFESNEQQIEAFVAACDEGSSIMVDKVVNNLQVSQLSCISINGSEHFRFSDDLIHTLTEALIASKISLTSLFLRNHRITDVGVIQLCQLILVRVFLSI